MERAVDWIDFICVGLQLDVEAVGVRHFMDRRQMHDASLVDDGDIVGAAFDGGFSSPAALIAMWGDHDVVSVGEPMACTFCRPLPG